MLRELAPDHSRPSTTAASNSACFTGPSRATAWSSGCSPPSGWCWPYPGPPRRPARRGAARRGGQRTVRAPRAARRPRPARCDQRRVRRSGHRAPRRPARRVAGPDRARAGRRGHRARRGALVSTGREQARRRPAARPRPPPRRTGRGVEARPRLGPPGRHPRPGRRLRPHHNSVRPGL